MGRRRQRNQAPASSKKGSCPGKLKEVVNARQIGSVIGPSALFFWCLVDLECANKRANYRPDDQQPARFEWMRVKGIRTTVADFFSRRSQMFARKDHVQVKVKEFINAQQIVFVIGPSALFFYWGRPGCANKRANP